MTHSAPFIVLEGPEGAGKSVQTVLLADYLREQDWQVVVTREPGGTETGDAIRRILLQSDNLHLVPEAEALLMSAARAQHVREVILPALTRGHVVISDRYVDSTYAYQGGGRQLDIPTLEVVQKFATEGLEPDIRILLDLPVGTGLERRYGDMEQVNRIDRAPLEFHERVRATFLERAQKAPNDWIVIDASQTVEQVAESIRSAVESRINRLSMVSQALSTESDTL